MEISGPRELSVWMCLEGDMDNYIMGKLYFFPWVSSFTSFHCISTCTAFHLGWQTRGGRIVATCNNEQVHAVHMPFTQDVARTQSADNREYFCCFSLCRRANKNFEPCFSSPEPMIQCLWMARLRIHMPHFYWTMFSFGGSWRPYNILHPWHAPLLPSSCVQICPKSTSHGNQ